MSANAGPDIGPIPWATIEAAQVAERRRLDRSASPRNATPWLRLRCVWELCDEHITTTTFFDDASEALGHGRARSF
jgi:hypothetical protein